MDCILYHKLKSLLSVAFNSFKGFHESNPQLAAPTEPPLTSSQCNDTASNRGWLSLRIFLDYLSHAEAEEIIQQFETMSRNDCQLVFWTGIPREQAQKWANARGMLTLTTMMGPLMDRSNARCRRSSKGPKSWSKYVKGASIIFSLFASRAGTVTVLTIPPPLQLVDLRPGCTFLSLEEPILKGKLGLHEVKIKFVHPMVEGAEDFAYQVWPIDRTKEWTERFGAVIFTFKSWGRKTVQKKNAAWELVNKATPARNMAEAESSVGSKQAQKAKNIAKAEKARRLKQAKKARNLAKAEKARRLKLAKRARNVAKAESSMGSKQAQKAENIAKSEKARRLKQAKKAENLAKAVKARRLKLAKRARNVAKVERARKQDKKQET